LNIKQRSEKKDGEELPENEIRVKEKTIISKFDQERAVIYLIICL